MIIGIREMGAHHGSKASHGFAEDTCVCVCDLVFIIPLQAARRAKPAVEPLPKKLRWIFNKTVFPCPRPK